jgi:hypothetical protein
MAIARVTIHLKSVPKNRSDRSSYKYNTIANFILVKQTVLEDETATNVCG